MRTSVNRRGGGPMPEKNLWSHLQDALQHALSAIDRSRYQEQPAEGPGPPTTVVGANWGSDV